MHLHQSPRAKEGRLRRQCPASIVKLISLQLGLRRACKTDVVKCPWNYEDMTTSLGWTGTALPCKEKLIWSQSHTASSAGSSRHRPVFNYWGQQLRLNLAVLRSIWWSCWKTLKSFSSCRRRGANAIQSHSQTELGWKESQKLLATQGLTFLVIPLSIARHFCLVLRLKKIQHA